MACARAHDGFMPFIANEFEVLTVTQPLALMHRARELATRMGVPARVAKSVTMPVQVQVPVLVCVCTRTCVCVSAPEPEAVETVDVVGPSPLNEFGEGPPKTCLTQPCTKLPCTRLARLGRLRTREGAPPSAALPAARPSD